MGYDETLAERTRAALVAGGVDVVERKMFGGLCFMVGGSMCCGVVKSDLMVRVGPGQYTDALKQPHARPMDFTGRPLAGMVYVAPAGLKARAALEKWVGRGLRFVASLPAKKPPKKRAKRTPISVKTARDPRVDALLRTLALEPELAHVVSASEEAARGARKKFGSNGLKAQGRLFALFTQGTLVVKLPKDRVAALVRAAVGKPFDPGHGRLMKEWLAVTSTKASWLALAKESYQFVTVVTRR